MIEQYRAIVKELNIPCQVIDLPGPTEPEVGFVVTNDDSFKIDDYMVEKDLLKTDLGVQYDSWFDVPYTSLMPEGITSPVECYLNIHKMMNDRSCWEGRRDEIDTFLILNVPTNEVVKATVNYKDHTYHLSGDVTGWLHVTTLPDL